MQAAIFPDPAIGGTVAMGEERPSRFRQSDISRAAKGMRQAGYDLFTVRIDPRGNIEIITAQNQPTAKRGSSWDDVLDQ